MAMLAEVQMWSSPSYERRPVSDSVLSKHLSALADAGYARLRKAALDGRSRTWASATRAGRRAFVAHVAALRMLAAVADRVAAE